MQSLSELHQAARAYAEAGIPVFPCEENGKQPITTNGFYDATTDLGQIDRWWGQNQNYNVAFCPGAADLFVVDIDPGADLSILQKLPPTYTVRTPRGGHHFYYEGAGKTTAGKLAQYVDTRSSGGYVLLPGSTINSRKYYIEQELNYAATPEWISEKIAAIDTPIKAAVEEKDLPVNIERANKRLEQYIKQDDVAVEGCGGDERTYRMACELRDLGLSTDTAIELIICDKGWNDHCRPPWDEAELRTKFENAERYQQNEAGAYGVEPAQEVFGALVKSLYPPTYTKFYFKDEEELDEEPDTKWLVNGLISERSTVMLFGASGSYKSFLTLDICLAVATGKDTFGSPTKAGMVFYGALEGKAHLKKGRRAWRILKGIEKKIDNFYVGRAPMTAAPGEVEEFKAEIHRRAKTATGARPALIIIDTLSKSMAGMDENNAADANRFIQFCDSLVDEFGCTVVAVHHNGKGEGRGARGSSAFQAGFDTVLEVIAHKASKAVEVWVRKHKDAEERTTPWTFEGRVTGPSLTFEATTAAQHKLLTGEGTGLSQKAVGAALKDLGAFGEAGVTTAVLAAQLTVLNETDGDEERSTAVARTSRALTSHAGKMLEGYAARQGRSLVWSLPAPT